MVMFCHGVIRYFIFIINIRCYLLIRSCERLYNLLPRCRGPNITHSMHISTQHRLLINRTMRSPVSPSEPAQSIPLARPHKHLLHLLVVEVLSVRKVVQHLRLVDKRQHGRNSRRLARHERFPASKEDQTRRADHKEDNDSGEDRRREERRPRFRFHGQR